MRERVDKRSSTSSFDKRVLLDMAATIAVAALVLVSAEMVFRSVASNLSRNSQVLEMHTDRADRIRGENERPSMLILGNSTSGDAIDAELLAQELRQLGADVLIEHQPADSSAMRDWYLELKNHFLANGAVPDYLVLPVGDPRDLTRVNPRTEDLVHFFLADDDLSDLFELDNITSFEERTGIHLARSSTLYCFRGRIQKRVLFTVVPGYAELRVAMNTGGGGGEALITPAWADLMHNLTERYDIQPLIVALPTRDLGGRLLSEDRSLAEAAGWPVLEPGAAANWSEADVPDGLHLTRPAQLRFTSMLAESLAAILNPNVADAGEQAALDFQLDTPVIDSRTPHEEDGESDPERDTERDAETDARIEAIAEAIPKPEDLPASAHASTLGAADEIGTTIEPNVGALHTDPSLGAAPAALLRQ